MALMDTGTPAKPVGLNGQGQAPSAVKAVGDEADKKAKKLEAAKRFKERRAKEAAELRDAAIKFRKELESSGLYEKLSATAKDFVVKLTTEKTTTPGLGGPSVFVTLFGASAKVGDSITLETVFNKTYKGKSTMDILLKRWAEKGIKVSFEINKDKFLASTYKIVELPKA
jgi:hypothetical protein